MVAIPRFVVSHTVTGTCSIHVTTDEPSTATVTIPVGTYWPDPVYGSASYEQTDTVCLVGRLASLLGNASSSYYDSTGNGAYYTSGMSLDDVSKQFNITHASTTSAGRMYLKRLGYEQTRDSALALTLTTPGVLGIWSPLRGESGDMLERPAGETGSVLVSADGTAYTTATAAQQLGRIVSLYGLTGAQVQQRNGAAPFVGGANPFRSLVYDWAIRGERIRYYQDTAGTYRYLTAACSATANQVTLSTTIGSAATICVDGEQMGVLSLASGTTYNVSRLNPVAHDKYSPVGVDGAFVATYVLALDGGNVNRSEFNPEPRGPLAAARWDLDVSLVRANP